MGAREQAHSQPLAHKVLTVLIPYLALSPQRAAVAAHFTMAPFPAVKMVATAALVAAVQEAVLLDRAIPQAQAPPKAATAVGQLMRLQTTVLVAAVALRQWAQLERQQRAEMAVTAQRRLFLVRPLLTQVVAVAAHLTPQERPVLEAQGAAVREAQRATTLELLAALILVLVAVAAVQLMDLLMAQGAQAAPVS